jgi:putative FmdB family regulatory protein
MPAYDYVCLPCGARFERQVPIILRDVVWCACGALAERQTAAPAFHLKGSGWYTDGYTKTGGA